MQQEIERQKRASQRKPPVGAGRSGVPCPEEYPCSSGGRSKEASQIQARNRSSQQDKEIPGVNEVAHQEDAFPALGEGNRARLQD